MIKIVTIVLMLGFLANQNLFAIDDHGNSESFHEAAWCGDEAYFIEYVLDAPAASRLDREGLTPLDWAVKGGHGKIIQMLGKFFTQEQVEASLEKHTKPKQQFGPVCPDAPGRRGFPGREIKRQRVMADSPVASLVAPIDLRHLYADSFAEVDHP